MCVFFSKNKKEKELEEKQDKAVAFFEKLENIIFGNLEEMNVSTLITQM